MLKQIHGEKAEKNNSIEIKDAAFPKPFSIGLEYNAPVHGTWNIVHTGMLIPQSHQIYVCAMNCNRGVMMTAVEMDAADRFSTITITEKDMMYGMEKLIVQGVSDILMQLQTRPRMILLFPSCIHHFIGTDMVHIYHQLEERFPDICFARCFMDPTMQKHALPPDVRLRREMYAGLYEMEKQEKEVAFLGNNLLLDEGSEVKQMLRKAGFVVYELAGCKTYEDYLSHGKSRLNLVTHPNALEGAKKLKKRLGTEFLYLPVCYQYDKIQEQEMLLAKTLGIKEYPDFADLQEKAEEALKETKQVVAKRKIAIDFTFTSRPLGLARLLLEHEFLVSEIYLDVIHKEEEANFRWLQEHAPKLRLISTMHHQMRKREYTMETDMLALGQKAAYFVHTNYFVNTIEENGYYGIAGISALAQDMKLACEQKKDAKSILPKKGLGCQCII